MGGFVDDVRDLEAAVAYLTNQFGYVVDIIIGHSRGVVTGFRWMCTAKEAQTVRGFVNASGRYRMRVRVFLRDCTSDAELIGDTDFTVAYLRYATAF